jgi:hypothetical protein
MNIDASLGLLKCLFCTPRTNMCYYATCMRHPLPPTPVTPSPPLLLVPACLHCMPPSHLVFCTYSPSLPAFVFQTELSTLNTHACRSGLVNLAPTSTGSATAIALIFPELKGKLNGLAVRVPLTNSSITDCVFEVGSLLLCII